MHVPVLLNEAVKFLDPKPGEFVIDGTLGAGGHAMEILKRISPGGKFLGIDWNGPAVENFGSRTRSFFPQAILVQANYADLSEILQEKKLGLADGLLLDLGFSSDELEFSGRGFSFRREEPLIMTYANDLPPVRDILSGIQEEKLAGIIREFGGERFAGRIAGAIKAYSRRKKIETSAELAGIIAGAVPKNYERGRIHPATRTFQALRIYANHELENLETVLEYLPNILRAGGRAVAISFHSLEDRIVKNRFRDIAGAGKAKILTPKPVTASPAEITANPRSRSAKLRAIRLM